MDYTWGKLHAQQIGPTLLQNPTAQSFSIYTFGTSRDAIPPLDIKWVWQAVGSLHTLYRRASGFFSQLYFTKTERIFTSRLMEKFLPNTRISGWGAQCGARIPYFSVGIFPLRCPFWISLTIHGFGVTMFHISNLPISLNLVSSLYLQSQGSCSVHPPMLSKVDYSTIHWQFWCDSVSL